jgi:hypothetical protein
MGEQERQRRINRAAKKVLRAIDKAVKANDELKHARINLSIAAGNEPPLKIKRDEAGNEQ